MCICVGMFFHVLLSGHFPVVKRSGHRHSGDLLEINTGPFLTSEENCKSYLFQQTLRGPTIKEMLDTGGLNIVSFM